MPEIISDDDLYRVNPIWLGPPNATMPFRARYVAWGVGIAMFLLTFAAARIWFPFGFFTLAWSAVIAIALTRLICSKITHERPLGSVAAFFGREIATPRQQTRYTGGAAAPSRVRINPTRPRPNPPASEQPQLSGPAAREAPRA